MAAPKGAGELRKRVTIQKPVKTRDAVGTETVVWTDVTKAWAKVEEAGAQSVGFESTRQEGVQTALRHRVWIRHVAGIEPKQRVLLGTRILNIEAVRNRLERDRWLELVCAEET